MDEHEKRMETSMNHLAKRSYLSEVLNHNDLPELLADFVREPDLEDSIEREYEYK